MRKLILYVIGVSFLTLSCSKYLDKDPIGILPEEDVLVEPTEGTVSGLVENSYRSLANTLNIYGNWDWANGLVIRNDFILEDIASGDGMKHWGDNSEHNWMDAVANYNYIASNQAFYGIWIYDYEGISRSNIAIFQLTDPTILSKIKMTEERRKQLLAEVYFLRAFYYFDLVKYFGDVPMVLKPLNNFQEAYEVAIRSPKSEIYKQIKADLELAVEYLPSNRFSNQSEKWRVSKGAAIALLAKIALFEENWKEVLKQVNNLEALGVYQLNANYFDSFDNTKSYSETENVFIYDHESGKNPNKGNGISALMGWGFVASTENFSDSFEANDPRKDLTVNVGDKIIYKLVGVQSNSKGNDNSPADRVFIRYADVLLWKAEALIRDQQITEGVKIINKIRERARGGNTSILPDHAIITDMATAMKWLQQERRVEFGFESHRMSDLRRWGIAKATLQAMGKPFEDKHMLYPIPQTEIDKTNSKISQNPGY